MREKVILEKLIEHNDYIDLDFFSQMLGVTTRTVRKHIQNLMDNGLKNGFSIELKRKHGYYLKIKDREVMESYLDKLDKIKVDEDPKQRISKMVSNILTSVGYITVDGFSDILNVSRSTVIKEIKEAEKIIKGYGLDLIRKPYYGVIIKGNELKIRKAILKEYMKNENMYSKLDCEFIDEEECLNIKNKIMIEMKNNQIITENRHLKYIVLIIKISIYRMKNKKYINDNTKSSNKNLKPYIKISRNILQTVEKEFNVKVTEGEIVALSCELHSKCSKIYEAKECNQNLKRYIEKFLSDLDKQYNSSFSKDDELIKSLLFHIQSLLERLYQNVTFKNPIADEISVRYSNTFDISIKFSKMIEKIYDVVLTKDEIAYITMHFAAHIEKNTLQMISDLKKIAVICSSGGGSSHLLKLKLQNLFYTSNIKSFSFIDIKDVNDFNPDLIVSIVKLNKEDFNKPIMYIKELIDDKEILKLKDALENKVHLKNNTCKENEDQIEALFNKELFYITSNKKNESYEEIIHERAKEIKNYNYAKENYARYVIERENICSTVYKNMVAAPHPIEMCGNKNVISVTILKNPIEYKTKKVKVIFLICLKEHQLALHKKISNFLINIIEDKEFTNKMTKVKSYEDFMIEIKKILK